MSAAIQTRGLTKRYGDVVAVDSLDLHVESGEVYGFLGLNGAGKTTTIRALLGMVRPSSGTVSLLGRAVGLDGNGPWRRVGHLVERPASYPELTVRENLEIARRMYGVEDRGATSSTLERFGLGTWAERRGGRLSTGNRQRLSLARALLHEPELLILDEPANALDPAGVVEVRELLGTLARERGVAIFMSSHILAEVNRLATRVGILHRGRLIEELDAAELKGRRARRLVVDARDRAAARSALEAAEYAVTVDGRDGGLMLADPHALEAPDEVARVLVAAGTAPLRLAVEQENLEDHFLRLVGASA